MPSIDLFSETIIQLKMNVPLSLESLKIQGFKGYEVLEVLGQGGMGVVFKARQLVPERIVAIKTLRPKALMTQEDYERFGREASIIAQLNIPEIVKVFEVGQMEGSPFFSMDYCPNGSLAQLCSQILPSIQNVAIVSKAIASTMSKVHKAGVIHRDLKPSNILLDENMVPKISDFGLASSGKFDGVDTASGQIMGSPSFMAPEQIKSNSNNHSKDFKIDVYGIGATLYFLLTGRPPFLNSDLMQTLWEVTNRDPIPPSKINPSVPRDLETICLKCLKKNPESRYSSMAMVEQELVAFLEGRPILARPAGWFEHGWKWVCRQPLVAALIFMVIMVGITGFAATLFQLGVARNANVIADQNALVAIEEKKVAQKAQGLEKQRRLELDDLFQKSLAQIVEFSFLESPKLGANQAKFLEEILPQFEKAYLGPDALVEDDVEKAMYGRQRVAQISGRLGDQEKARKILFSILEVLSLQQEQIQSRVKIKITTLVMISNCYFLERNWASSIKWMNDARVLLPSVEENLDDELKMLGYLIMAGLGKSYIETGLLDEAERFILDSEVRLMAVNIGLQESRNRKILASSLNSAAEIYSRKSNWAKAILLHEKAILEARRFLLLNKNDPESRLSLLGYMNNLSATLLRSGQQENAMIQMDKTLAEFEIAVAEFPGFSEIKEKYAGVLANQGAFLKVMKKDLDALLPLEKACKILGTLRTQFPENLAYHEHLVRVLKMIADSHSFMENYEDGYLAYKKLFNEYQTFLNHNPADLQLLKNQASVFSNLIINARKANVSNAVMIDLLTQGIGVNLSLHHFDSKANDRSVMLSHYFSDLGKSRYLAFQFVLADKSFGQSLEWRKKIPDGISPETYRDSWILTIHFNFANSLFASGKVQQAKEVIDSGILQLNGAWFEKPPKGAELLLVSKSWVLRSKIETELGNHVFAKACLLSSQNLYALKESLPQSALLSSLNGNFSDSNSLVLRMFARRMFDPTSVFTAFQAMANASESLQIDEQLKGQSRLLAVTLLKQMLTQDIILNPREKLVMDAVSSSQWIRIDSDLMYMCQILANRRGDKSLLVGDDGKSIPLLKN